MNFKSTCDVLQLRLHKRSGFFKHFNNLLAGTLILLLLVDSSNTVSAQDTSSYIDSLTHETMKPRNFESKFYNELWTYHITLDNGYQIVYAFTITDFGSYKDRVTGCKFQTTWRNGKHHVVRKEYDPKELVYDSTQNMLRLHPDRNIYARGKFDDKHQLLFETNKDGNSYFADLEITSIAKPQVRGDGMFEVDGNRIGLYFPIPHGKVKGTLAINDDTLHNISGTVYMDHLIQTELGVNIFDSGYRFKQGDDSDGIVGTFLKPQKSDALAGYAITFNNGISKIINPVKQQIKAKKELRGINYGEKIDFTLSTEEQLTIEINEIIKTYSILDEIGGFKSFIAKKIMGGEMVQFNGTATINSKKSAVFNYFITD